MQHALGKFLTHTDFLSEDYERNLMEDLGCGRRITLREVLRITDHLPSVRQGPPRKEYLGAGGEFTDRLIPRLEAR
jgi:hypothetical protein